MITLYYHGGSANHGCEAIVRSTKKILDEPCRLFSTSIDEEYKYGVDKIVDVFEDQYRPVKKNSVLYWNSALYNKLHKSDYKFIKYGHRDFLNSISANDICFSIGGDNYCYQGTDKLGFYNRMLHEKRAKTVLWGCSIEPAALSASVIKDLNLYDMIITRESLSFEALKNVGITDNVFLFPDPAFQLEKSVFNSIEYFKNSEVIGINASPLVSDLGNKVMENYDELIRYILSETSYKVLLIPHVVKPESDDRKVLKIFKEKFSYTDRVDLMEDCDCEKLKYVISQCKMFIGARTHATIAAYSSCIPTLVVGYSIKARGIAKDIFGSDENYVVSAQSLSEKDDLVKAYKWLSHNELSISNYLREKMPSYSMLPLKAKDVIRRLKEK